MNLIAFAKNLRHPTLTLEDEFKENLTKLVEYISSGKISKCARNSVAQIFLEQIDLLFKSKHHLRYSPELLLLSYILHATSAKAYERLLEEHLFILPSPRTFKK